MTPRYRDPGQTPLSKQHPRQGAAIPPPPCPRHGNDLGVEVYHHEADWCGLVNMARSDQVHQHAYCIRCHIDWIVTPTR